jgi:hypothetical protein
MTSDGFMTPPFADWTSPIVVALRNDPVTEP